VNGHSKDVNIGSDGRVLEVEEHVEMSALPAAAQASLKQKAGSGSITKIESVTLSPMRRRWLRRASTRRFRWAHKVRRWTMTSRKVASAVYFSAILQNGRGLEDTY
jgi:hypothetical protein